MSENGATFSPDRKHRYSLWRTIDRGELAVLFIGLNPSTADETKDDPTIRRCVGFARDWGFSKMYMGNLFSYVTAYPKELTKENCLKNDDENRLALSKMARESLRVVFCWGNNGVLHGQGKKIVHFINTWSPNDPVCFGINKNGQPKHPLYLPKNAEVIVYDAANL
jgi:hypothetical protein